jgi:hypothetical protein
MADAYLIQLDLERLTANLTVGEKRPVSVEEAIRMMAESSIFHRPDIGGDWFLCEEISLDWFAKGEVRSSRPYA